MSAIDIFVSYSSKDKSLGASVVELLKAAFIIGPDRIRAFSVAGQGLRAGEDEDLLRKEIVSAKLLIGIITKHSIESAYVLLELGARWGTKKPLFPMLGGGASAAILPGPLLRQNALSCDDDSQVQQLITDASRALDLKANRPETYFWKIGEVVNASRELKEASSKDILVTWEGLMANAQVQSVFRELAARLGDPMPLVRATTATQLAAYSDYSLEFRKEALMLVLGALKAEGEKRDVRQRLANSWRTLVAVVPPDPNELMDLIDAQLSHLALHHFPFSRCNLISAQLQECDLGATNFVGSKLWRAQLCKSNCSSADFSNADLWDANFEDVNFESANFTGARVNDRTNFKKASLANATLPTEIRELAQRQGACNLF